MTLSRRSMNSKNYLNHDEPHSRVKYAFTASRDNVTPFISKCISPKYRSGSVSPLQTPLGPDISIPGIRKIFSKSEHVVTKLFWVAAITSCFAFTLFQVSNRVSYYLKNPVAATVTTQKERDVDFPAIMFCPAENVNRCKSSRLFQDRIKAHFNPNIKCEDSQAQNLKFGDINLTLDAVWKNMRILEEYVNVTSLCSPVADKPDICYEDPIEITVNKTYEKTVAGECLVTVTTEPFNYRGGSTFLEIKISNKINGQNEGLPSSEKNSEITANPNGTTGLPRDGGRKMKPPLVRIFLFQKRLHYKYEVLFGSFLVPTNHYTSARLEIKTFQYLNRRNTPCWDKVKAKECANKCINNYLTSVVNCSLPYMQSKLLKPCNTWAEYKKAGKTALDAISIFNATSCSCERECEDVVYSVATSKEDETSDDYTVFKLYFRDNLIEFVQETSSYDASALFSDIGGNLGFFVGVCVLTIAEMVEVIVRFSYRSVVSFRSHNR